MLAWCWAVVLSKVDRQGCGSILASKKWGVYLIYGQVSSACLSMLRKNEGHCLTYGHGAGLSLQGVRGRVGVFGITCF